MAEYIERDELYSKICKGVNNPAIRNWLGAIIADTPAADVVSVVRCRDCRYLMFSDCYGECRRGNLGMVRPDDYCSYGKRMEKNAEKE